MVIFPRFRSSWASFIPRYKHLSKQKKYFSSTDVIKFGIKHESVIQ